MNPLMQILLLLLGRKKSDSKVAQVIQASTVLLIVIYLLFPVKVEELVEEESLPISVDVVSPEVPVKEVKRTPRVVKWAQSVKNL
jgi:hypothetical protein